MIITKLEQYDYRGATAIASVMLLFSFVLLLLINGLQAWTAKRTGGIADGRRYHAPPRRRPCLALRVEGGDPRDALVKWTILGIALGFFAIFLLLPLVAVFVEALRKG